MAVITETRTQTAKIVPHLWFADKAVEAASFYASLFPDSSVDDVTPIPVDTPSGPAGSAQVIEFTLAGQDHVVGGVAHGECLDPPPEHLVVELLRLLGVLRHVLEPHELSGSWLSIRLCLSCLFLSHSSSPFGRFGIPIARRMPFPSPRCRASSSGASPP